MKLNISLSCFLTRDLGPDDGVSLLILFRNKHILKALLQIARPLYPITVDSSSMPDL